MHVKNDSKDLQNHHISAADLGPPSTLIIVVIFYLIWYQLYFRNLVVRMMLSSEIVTRTAIFVYTEDENPMTKRIMHTKRQ